MVEEEQEQPMNQGINHLQTFNPGDTNPELLERTLIGRKDLVDYLESSVFESITSGNRYQQLIIGPRGSGKTHTLKVLHNRISVRSELTEKIKIAYLCEDEYGVATFLDWLIRILRSFIRWEPERAGYLTGEIDKLKKVPENDRERIAVQTLLNYIQDKLLLIIVENIGNIFDQVKGFGKKGQQKFRDLVQQHPVFIIVASNQAIFEEVQKEDMPFHNFFKVIPLRKLTIEQAIIFLKAIAEEEGNSNFLKFLNSDEGKGRIKTIFEFTGGNHRLLVTFYEFLKTDYINKLSATFLKTINDLIPYYQNLMNVLSAQQQKIVQYLSQIRIPSNVKEIAENCFSKPNVISKQMTILIRLKYVDAQSVGRETYYELSEPLLRICNEVKENKGGPVKLFIDFLGNLYHADEIKRRFMRHHILSKVTNAETTSDIFQEQSYCRETFQRYFPVEFQRSKINEFENATIDFQIKAYIEELERAGAFKDIIDFTDKIPLKDKYLMTKTAKAFAKIGDIDHQIDTAIKVLQDTPEDIEALSILASGYVQKGDASVAEKYLRELVRLDNANISAFILLALNLIQKNNFVDAEEFLLKVIELDYKNIETNILLAIISTHKGNYDQALNYLKKATELQPKDAIGWMLIGKALSNLRKYDDAIEVLKKSVDLDNNNIDAIEGLGLLLGQEGKFEQSLIYCKKLTELKPQYAKGWIFLGMALNGLDKIPEAKEALMKAIELENNNINALELLGGLLMDEGNFQEAFDYSKKIIELAPQESEGWSLMGATLNGLDKIPEAKEALMKAIELENNNIYALELLGSLLMDEGNFQEALNYFKKIAELDPQNSEGWSLMGETLSGLDKISEAKEALMKAIELDTSNINALEKLGRILMDEDNFQEALKYFKKIAELDPQNSEGLRFMSVALMSLGKIQEAKQFLIKSIELDDNNISSRMNLTKILLMEGSSKEAYDQIVEVLQRRPNNSDTLNSIGEIYRETGQYNEAVNYYNQASFINSDIFWPRINLVTCCIGLHKFPDALQQLKTALEIAKQQNIKDKLIEGFVENHIALFLHASQNNIPVYFDDAVTLIYDYGYKEQFIKSIPLTIFSILRLHEEVKEDKFTFIEEYLSKKFQNDDSMIVPMKFLHIGNMYLKANDKKALLKLTKEERTTFKKFVLDYLKESEVK